MPSPSSRCDGNWAAVRALQEILARTEFSAAAYLATAGIWHAPDDVELVNLLAEYDSEKQRVCKTLLANIEQLGATRTATCFPADLTCLNDLDLRLFLPQLVTRSRADIALLNECLTTIGTSSSSYPAAISAVVIQKALLGRLQNMNFAPPPAAVLQPSTSQKESVYRLPAITIQIAIDVGRTFVMQRPNHRSAISWWNALTRTAGFTPFAFPHKLSSVPTPLGWACSLPLDESSLSELSSALLPNWLDGNNISGELILFTTGIGFLVVRAHLSAASQPISIDSMDIMRLISADELGLEGFLQPFTNRFIEHLEGNGFAEFMPLRRSFSDSQHRTRVIGSYIIFFVPGREAIASNKPSAAIETLAVTGLPLSMQVEWDIACIWPTSGKEGTEVVQDAFHQVDDTILAANVAWFGFVIMDDFVTDVAEEMFLDGTVKRSREIPNLHDVRLAYLQAADAMRPLRWTRATPHYEILKFIHRVWGIEEQWKTVEERIQLLVVHAVEQDAMRRERFQRWLGLAGLLLTGMTMVSVFADVYSLFREADHRWAPWLGMAFGFFPVAGVLIVYMFMSRRRRAVRWRVTNTTTAKEPNE